MSEGREIDRDDVLGRVQHANTPTEIEAVARDIGVTALAWQTWTEDHVHIWDRFPQGFFSIYYGEDSDRFCAIANAIRETWITFTFDQARAALTHGTEGRRSASIWDGFGMRGGVCLMHGSAWRRSATILVLDGDAESALDRNDVTFAAMAARLDTLWSRDDARLFKATRRRFLLSPAERSVVRAQVDHPALSLREQAALLGVAPRTIQRRHRVIARKLGVSSFAGAVASAMKDPACYRDQ